MGYLPQVKRSKIFNEFSLEKRKKFFSIIEKKVLPGVDTLYFSVRLKEDSKELNNKNIENFIDILNSFKSLDTIEDCWFDYDNELLYKNRSFGIYKHCISKNDMFDIFICNKILNDSTPRVIVQIRSNMLWSFGERYSLNYIYNILNIIFKFFNIEILDIKENRIDFCYHTNSIQDFNSYFSDEYIKNNLETSFMIGNKVFRKDKKNLSVEYLSLGNRKSNNLFFRTYNKTLEVVELAYKDFFFDIWKAYGLISEYDYYILSYAYEHANYNKIYEGMIKFYIEYGQDIETKNLFNSLLGSESTTIEDYRKAIKGICPTHTKVQNFEFQTMRKFYKSGDDLINQLPILENCNNDLLRLFQVLDNRKIFLDYLTSKTVNFKSLDLKESSDFWKRIQNVKLDKTVCLDYIRKYDNDKNINLVLNKLKSNLATYQLYKGNFKTDIITDVCDLVNTLNDNDIEELKRYENIKRKKEKAQKNINALKTFSNDI